MTAMAADCVDSVFYSSTCITFNSERVRDFCLKDGINKHEAMRNMDDDDDDDDDADGNNDDNHYDNHCYDCDHRLKLTKYSTQSTLNIPTKTDGKLQCFSHIT